MIFPLFSSYLSDLPVKIDMPYESYPNGKLAMQACEGWSRCYGMPGLCLTASSYGVLEGLSAGLSAYGDSLPLLLVGIVRKREMGGLLQSASGISAESHAIRKIQELSHLDIQSEARGPILLLLALSEFQSSPQKILRSLFVYFQSRFVEKKLHYESLRYPLESSFFRDARAALLPTQKITKDRKLYLQQRKKNIFKNFPEILSAWASGLAASKRPLLYLGARALETSAIEPIVSVAHSLSAPILLDVDAACLPVSILGRLRDNIAPELLLEPTSLPAFWALFRSDCVLALDAEFTEGEGFALHDFRFRLKKLYRLSSKKEFAHRPLLAPAKKEFRMRNEISVVMQGLLQEWGADGNLDARRVFRSSWQAKVARLHKRYRQAIASSPKQATKQGLLDPALLTKKIFENASSDSLFLAEGNAAGMWFWSFSDGRPVIYPNRMASIGVALGWMLGAGIDFFRTEKKLSYFQTQDKVPLWVFLGDGSFLYNPMILKELKNRGIGGNIILFNNSAWSAIRIEQRYIFFGRFVKTQLPERNLADLARVYGVEARRIETEEELESALLYATKRQNILTEILVLDVRLPKDALPYAGLSFALAELDYILRPKFWSFLGSLFWDMLRGRFPWRIIRIFLRMIF